MLRYWNPDRFLQQQKGDFLSLADHDPDRWHSEVLKEAFEIFRKKFLKQHSYEEYVDTLLKTCIELSSEELPPPYFGRTLSFWCSKLVSRISQIARDLELQKLRKEHPNQIYKSVSKTIRPQIKPWVDAFRILSQLPVLETIPHQETPWFFHATPELTLDLHYEPLKQIADRIRAIVQGKSFEVRVSTWDEVLPDYKQEEGEDLLRIEFTANEDKDIVRLQLEKRTYSLNYLMHQIEYAITHQAEEKFGYDGEIVARILLGEEFKERQSGAVANNKRKRGKPPDEFINQTILSLDAKGIDKLTIRRFVDALQGNTRRKGSQSEKDTIWNKEQGRYIPLSEYNAEKSIRKQIIKLGGNYLRYLADLRVKETGECERCIWGWNQDGEFTRAMACAQHKETKEGPQIRFTSENWLKDLTAVKGEDYYANALTWRIGEPKSKKVKRK